MAQEKFIGKWEEESKEGFDAFADAIGVAPDKREFYKQARTRLQYERDGEEWRSTVGVVGIPDARVFSFQLGKPYDSASIDGSPMSSLVKAEGSGFVETHTFKEGTPLNGVAMNITRYIDPDDKMVVETCFQDIRMTSLYHRV